MQFQHNKHVAGRLRPGALHAAGCGGDQERSRGRQKLGAVDAQPPLPFGRWMPAMVIRSACLLRRTTLPPPGGMG